MFFDAWLYIKPHICKSIFNIYPNIEVCGILNRPCFSSIYSSYDILSFSDESLKHKTEKVAAKHNAAKTPQSKLQSGQ